MSETSRFWSWTSNFSQSLAWWASARPKSFISLMATFVFSNDVSNRLLAMQLLKTVFQLKDENQFPISGFFMPFRKSFSVMLFWKKRWTEGKKFIIKTYFWWESRESLITVNFLNAGKWEIGLGKRTLRLACPKSKLEFKFLSSPGCYIYPCM